MIGDCSVNVAAHCRQECHQRTEAITLDSNLAGRLRQSRHTVDGVLYVLYTGVSVVGLIQPKAVPPISLRGDCKVDARLLTPKQVGGDRHKTLLGQFITGLADIGIYSEQLL